MVKSGNFVAFSRNAFKTTIMDEKAIAAAATTIDKRPVAAKGIATRLYEKAQKKFWWIFFKNQGQAITNTQVY